MNEHEYDKPHWPTVWMVIIALLAAFAFVGQGDYQVELERENARLKASVAGCRLAAAMHEPGEARQ